jgi:ArsR family transcriptional regulator
MIGRTYDEEARLLKALAHPTRLRLMDIIREHGPCVKAMEEELGVAQPNISQHLSVLRNLGIVEAKRDGNLVCYRIKNPYILKLLSVVFDESEKGGSVHDPRIDFK